MNYLIKTGDFSLVSNYLRPSINSRQLIFNINAVVLIDIILLKFMKMVKCILEIEYFYCILEKKKLYFQNKNIKSYRLCSFKRHLFSENNTFVLVTVRG